MSNAQTLKNIPQEIRSWLASANTGDAIRRINAELDMQENDIVFIPFLIYKLASKEIEPAKFTEELSNWINIPIGSARTIALEIKEKILTPISEPLKEFGVDINLINVKEDEVLRPIIAPLPPPPPPKIEYKPVPPPPMGGTINNTSRESAGSFGETPKKGGIHIIGDAHEHSAGEKIMTDDDTSNSPKEIKPILGSAPSPVTPKPEKIIIAPPVTNPIMAPKLVIKDGIATKSDETITTPFMLHKETNFTPVAKEHEWSFPVKSAIPEVTNKTSSPFEAPRSPFSMPLSPATSTPAPKSTPPTPPAQTPPPAQKPMIAPIQKIESSTPQTNSNLPPSSKSLPPLPPTGASAPSPKKVVSLPKIVNFDADTIAPSTPLVKPPIVNLKTDQKNIVSGLLHNQNQELTKSNVAVPRPPTLPPKPDSKGNTVDLR